MRVTVLGSGTSTGIPMPACPCPVCKSTNPRNKRLRTSLFIELSGKDLTLPNPEIDHTQIVARVLIDTTPDFRYQALRAQITHIDAVLYTHAHADHIFGMDDLRSFNFVNGKRINCYADEKTTRELKLKFSYAFDPDDDYQGGGLPQLELLPLAEYQPLIISGVKILPLKLIHGRLPILGFRIGSFAYLTDCSEVPPATHDKLGGLKYLILDGLRHRPHPTHFTIAQAVTEAARIGAEKTYLTHIAHEIDHEQENQRLIEATNGHVELAYDGLVLEV